MKLLTPLASLNRMAEWAGSTDTSTALCGVLRLEVLFLISGSLPPPRPPEITSQVWSSRDKLIGGIDN